MVLLVVLCTSISDLYLKQSSCGVHCSCKLGEAQGRGLDLLESRSRGRRSDRTRDKSNQSPGHEPSSCNSHHTYETYHTLKPTHFHQHFSRNYNHNNTPTTPAI